MNHQASVLNSDRFSEITAAWHVGFEGEASNTLALQVAVGLPVHRQMAYALQDILSTLHKAQEWVHQGLWVVGAVAYEAATAFDSALQVQSTQADEPLVWFQAYQPEQIVLCQAHEWASVRGETPLTPWVDQNDMGWFEKTFDRIQQAIQCGEFYQVNLTTILKSQWLNSKQSDCLYSEHTMNAGAGAGFALFLKLLQSQPAKYSMYLKGHEHLEILSLSPELFFQVHQHHILAQPMKGTRPAGSHVDSLADSAKDRAENVMIVDLLRNDLARVCEPGSVQVRSLFDVMHLPTVEQMTSTIVGRLSEHLTWVDAFAALFPCGSVTGAPKVQAMKRIAEWESAPRGVYCGAMGVLRPNGWACFNVPIRTLTLNSADQSLSYGVGSAITWYSQPEQEKLEWWQKTAFLRQATTDFQLLETLQLQNGQWMRWSMHQARMQTAAAYFSWVWPQQRVDQAMQQAALQHSKGDFRGRCVLNASGEFQVFVEAYPEAVGDVQLRVMDAECRLPVPGEFVRFKTTWRPHYEYSLGANDFDGLLLNKEGFLTECCKGNLVLLLDGQLCTPRFYCDIQNSVLNTSKSGNLLPGVYRQWLLSENKAIEADLTLNHLLQAEAVWFINSLRQWVSVARIVDLNDTIWFDAAKR